ncbi:hypothetical protein M0G74_09295 [Microbulbifer sp. CAU 1566]|uniref:hypothetical protein n=1 Tax=Microbulbifer sp. CAU 1566 TaxID=2933269 RepID=UPI0020036CD9|nr:hypothetical protein [Microbulbifer sp. CAU 1566]MCK7597461.1 hypothetical protein [Microbulbifer sp. CAU 1566]
MTGTAKRHIRTSKKVPTGLANIYDILLIRELDFFFENRIMGYRELILTQLKTDPGAKHQFRCQGSHPICDLW